MKTKNILILISVLLILSALVILLYKDDVFKNLKGDDVVITKIPTLKNSFFNLNVAGSDASANTLLVPDLGSVGITKDGDYSDKLKECASANGDRSNAPSTCDELSVESILSTVEEKGDTFSNFIHNYVKNTAGPSKVGSIDGFYANFKGSGLSSWNRVLTANIGKDDDGEETCKKKLGVDLADYNYATGTCVGFEPGTLTEVSPDDDDSLFDACKNSISTSLNYKEQIYDNESGDKEAIDAYFQVSDISQPKRCSLGSGQITDVGSQSVNKWVRSNILLPTSQVPPYTATDGDRVITIGNPLQASDPRTFLQNSAGHACIGFTDNADIPFLEGESTWHSSKDACYSDFPCEYLSRMRNSKDGICNVNTCQNRDKDITEKQKEIDWSEKTDDDDMWVSAKKGCFRKLTEKHPLDGKKGKCECAAFTDHCSADHGKSTMDITDEATERMLKVKCYLKHGTFACPTCEGVLADNLALAVDKTIGDFSTPHYWCGRGKFDEKITPGPKPDTYWSNDYYFHPNMAVPPPDPNRPKGMVNGIIDGRVNSYHLDNNGKNTWSNTDTSKNTETLIYGCSPDSIPDKLKIN